MTKKEVSQQIIGSCYVLITTAEEAKETEHKERYENLERQTEETIRQLKIQLRNLRLLNRGLPTPK